MILIQAIIEILRILSFMFLCRIPMMEDFSNFKLLRLPHLKFQIPTASGLDANFASYIHQDAKSDFR